MRNTWIETAIEIGKNVVDLLSISTVVGVFLQLVPVAAGILSIAWAYYRVTDIRLSIQIKQEQLKKMED